MEKNRKFVGKQKVILDQAGMNRNEVGKKN